MKPPNCPHDCPGCGMTFSPDPKLCPLQVFDDWKLDIELDEKQFAILENRRRGGYALSSEGKNS